MLLLEYSWCSVLTNSKELLQLTLSDWRLPERQRRYVPGA